MHGTYHKNQPTALFATSSFNRNSKEKEPNSVCSDENNTEFFFNDTFSQNALQEYKRDDVEDDEAKENVKSEDENEDEIGNEVSPATLPHILQLNSMKVTKSIARKKSKLALR